MIRVGLVGYGLAGSVFHAPLIRACERMELCAVMTSRDVPNAVPDMAGLLDRSELVVIASPNATHFDLAKQALEAGKHVVIDKPVTATVEQADALIALADQRRLKLTVFHNRRWDSDFLTVRGLVPELGRVSLFEANWDRFRPVPKQGWKEVPDGSTGLLNDLGPHLIDQAMQLFGRPDAVEGDVVAQRAGARVDDYFRVTLHFGAMRAVLGASSLVADPRPRFAVHGDGGSFIKFGVDPQEAALKEGTDPLSDDFGDDPAHGTFVQADGTRRTITTARGKYVAFYEAVASSVLDGADVPVDPADARDVMAIIALARRSAREGRRFTLA